MIVHAVESMIDDNGEFNASVEPPPGTTGISFSVVADRIKVVTGKFSEGLEVLDFNGCAELDELDRDAFPLSLKKLALSGCKKLVDWEYVEDLPDSIEELSIAAEDFPTVGYGSTEVVKFPKNLKFLDASGNNSFQALDQLNLSDGIEVIICSSSEVRSISSKLPTALKNLTMRSSPHLMEVVLSEFPVGFESLDLSDSGTDLEFVNDFPATLKKLILRGCSSVKKLPKLPEGLVHLNLRECSPDLEIADGKLPASLKNLSLSALNIPVALPDGLEWLEIEGCENSLPLPRGLKWLTTSSLKLITNIPDSVERVMLSDSEDVTLEDLKKLPDSVKYLDLSACKNLRSLNASDLPPHLTDLIICDSEIAEITGDFPESLRIIKLGPEHNMTSDLVPSMELILKLVNLEKEKCKVSYPDSFYKFLKDFAELELRKIFKLGDLSHREDKPLPSTPLLFHRFLTQDLERRPKVVKEITLTLLPVLDYLEKNPKSQKWVKEIAALYIMDGCVNQPMSGLEKIISWIDVESKESIIDKLEAVKRPLSQQIVAGVYGTLGADIRPRFGVAVEFENFLLREIHKILLREGVIPEPWVGVPDDIPFEEEVHASFQGIEFKLVEIINSSLELVKNMLQEPLEEVATQIHNSGNIEIWGAIAFAKELEKEASKQVLNDAKVDCLSLLVPLGGGGSLPQYRLDDARSDLTEAQIVEFDSFYAHFKDEDTASQEAELFQMGFEKSAGFTTSVLQKTLDLIARHRVTQAQDSRNASPPASAALPEYSAPLGGVSLDEGCRDR
jgi:hypothetical protein